jgi:hypothetical protein
MGALTNYYVDPSGGDDTRSASEAQVVSTPWMTFSHAIDTITRDATNGDQINIKSTLEINADTSMAAGAVDLGDYGSPTQLAPLIIRGYSSAANDGGFGRFSGGVGSGTGTHALFGGLVIGHVHFIEMDLGKSGSSHSLFEGTNYAKCGGWSFTRCRLGRNCKNCVDLTKASYTYGSVRFIDCHFAEWANNGISVGGRQATFVYGCAFSRNHSGDNGKNAIDNSSATEYNRLHVINCIFQSTSSDTTETNNAEIRVGKDPVIIRNCSFYNSGSACKHVVYADDETQLTFMNNLVEGYDASGAYILYRSAGNPKLLEHGGNAGYDCTSWIHAGYETFKDWGDDEVGGELWLNDSPFTDAGTDYSPVDTGSVHGGSRPFTFIKSGERLNLDKGAIQRPPVAASNDGNPSERGLHPVEWGSV